MVCECNIPIYLLWTYLIITLLIIVLYTVGLINTCNSINFELDELEKKI